MKKIMAGLLALGLAFAVAGCSTISASTNQPSDGSAQESAAPAADVRDEPAEPTGPVMIEEVDEVPEDVAEYVRGSKDFFLILGGVEVNVDELQVAQRIPCYLVTEDGVVEGDELWPIYENSELIGLACKYEMDGECYFNLDFNLLDAIKESGLDTFAVVLDNATIWFFDGEQLIEAGPQIEVSPTRVPVTEDNEAEVMAVCKLGRLGAIIGGITE